MAQQRKQPKPAQQEAGYDPFRAAAEAWDDESAERGWRPEPGSLVVGKVEWIDVRTTDYGPCPVVVIREDDTGERVAVWALQTVLRNELVRLRPQPGERIAVKRLHDAQNKRGQNMARFRVAVQREAGAGPAFEWDRLRARPKPKPAPEPEPEPDADEWNDDELPF